MKTKIFSILVLAFSLQPSAFPLRAGTTIDAVNRCAYGSNLGWLDCRGDVTNGAVIGEYVCSGCVYAANVGWINLGSGSPANGIHYQNNSAADFGVNLDSLGNLRGLAWGANIGWVNFEATGAPEVDLLTGNLSGYAWSANCGWISLSNAFARVQTGSLRPGALAANGLPVAWLLDNFGTTDVDANADPDHDGMSIAQEYRAGTDPNDADSNFRITSFTRGTPTAEHTIVEWSSAPSRFYVLEESPSLNPGAWTDYLSEPVAGWNHAGFEDANPTNEFFRVRVYRPLMP